MALGVYYQQRAAQHKNSIAGNPHARALNRYGDFVRDSSVLHWHPLVRRRLMKVITSHLHYSGKRIDAGTFEPVRLRFYVDLMEAAADRSELAVISEAMALFVKSAVAYEFQIVAVPKDGNPLIGAAVARALKKDLLLVKRFGTRHNRKFDGRFRPGAQAILIDDVSSDGLFPGEPAQIMTDNDIKLNDCFTLIHRKEGSAFKHLRDQGFDLHALFHLSDDDIARLLGIEPLKGAAGQPK